MLCICKVSYKETNHAIENHVRRGIAGIRNCWKNVYISISDNITQYTYLIIYFFVGYISKFWRGFFPILIVELYNDNEIEETKPLSEEYGKLLEQLGHLFGDVHQIPIKESELKGIFLMIINKLHLLL